MHYAFGATMGAVYGAATEIRPEVHSLAGLPYGVALFLIADEVAVPLLGLAQKPTEYPLSSHLSGLGQHLVYGVTTELVRRTLREKLQGPRFSASQARRLQALLVGQPFLAVHPTQLVGPDRHRTYASA